MATSMEAPDWLHNDGGIDLLDSLGAPLFVAAGLVTFLGATISMTLFSTSFALSDIVWTVGGLDLTWAWLTATVVLVIAGATNEIGTYDEEWHRYVPMGMLVAHFVVLFPAGHDLVTSSDMVGLATLMLFGAGYYMLSYY